MSALIEFEEPINEAPPAYDKEEAPFEEELASPPTYSVPHIDPPHYADITNNAGEASLIEESRLEAGFEEPNYSIPRYDEIENDGYRPHPRYKLYEPDSKGNVRKVRSKRQILRSELNGEIMIRDHRTGNKGLVSRSMFVRECYILWHEITVFNSCGIHISR